MLPARAPLLLTPEELVQLTGYRQRGRQVAWLRGQLKLAPILRADGMPLVTRVQVEAALAGRAVAATSGPKWSKIAA
jgi:hypothetical protein